MLSSQPNTSTKEVVGRFRYAKGCIVYESELLQWAAQQAIEAMTTTTTHSGWRPEYAGARQSRDDNGLHHITLVTPHELKRLCQHYEYDTDNSCNHSSVIRAVTLALESLEQELLLQPGGAPRLLDLGVGRCCAAAGDENNRNTNESYYQVICWPDAAVWRHQHGLPRKDLHVTIGFRFGDVHSVPKNHQTLMIQQPNHEKFISLHEFNIVIQSVLQHLQTHRSLSMVLEPEIDMLLHHAAGTKSDNDLRQQQQQQPSGAKLIQALRAQCKLRSNQCRYADVVAIADQILCLCSPCDGTMISVRALRSLALMQLGQYQQALPALEETVTLMEKKQNPPTKTNLKRIVLLRAMVQCRGYLGLAESFCKFPRTEHLFDTGGKAVARDDLIVPDLDFFLDGRKIIDVEEKVDGANVGFSLSPSGQIQCQNRSHYVTASSQTQFQRLPLWLEQNGDALKSILEPGRHILFGEWCVMVHSLHYTHLPGFFLAFDLLDKFTGTFVSRKELHTLLQPTGIPVVPLIARRSFDSKKALLPLLETQSRFRDGTVEGIYLRYESDDGQVARRCKLVRPDFVSGLELHWSLKVPKKNSICRDMAPSHDLYTAAEAREQEQDDQLAEEQLSTTILGKNTIGNLFDPRSCVVVHLDDHRQIRMMCNFSFIFPGLLAVSSTPKCHDHIDEQRHLGVTLVVTLTEEEPLDPSWFTEEIENWFISVPNYEPPTLEQMDTICLRVPQAIAKGGCVLVHCGGGKGRAGTVAACLMVRFGRTIPTTIVDQYVNHGARMSAHEAMSCVRSARPGSLETVQQEHFVHEYTHHIWKEVADGGYHEIPKNEDTEKLEFEAKVDAATATNTSTEAMALQSKALAVPVATASTKHEVRQRKEQTRHQKRLQQRAPDVVMLVGIPGSGKSTFAKQLLADSSSSSSWSRISQDDLGRKRCEELAGQLSKQKNSKVVLDRCNEQVKIRRHWLELLFVGTAPSNNNNNNNHGESHHNNPCVVAVYFDVPLSVCIDRVQSRTDHPTIRGGSTPGSERIVRGFYERLQVPTTTEGFDRVHVIQSPEDARQLLQSWGVGT